MHRMLMLCLDAGIASLILIPVFWILNRCYFHSITKTIHLFILAVYFSAVFSAAGLPDIRCLRFDPNVNFRPFAYMFSDYENSYLNILLFVPLGFLLPRYWNCFLSLRNMLLFGFCTSFLIEFLQIFTYRASDINDLITNSLGTFLGWFAARAVIRFFPSAAPGYAPRELYATGGTAFAVMFFLHPYLAEWIWMHL